MTGLQTRSEQLATLVRSRTAGDRQRLLRAIDGLCSGSEAARRPEVQALLADVLTALVVEAERDVRARLAAVLAPAPWVPHAIVSVLALDEIDVAGPVIARSPRLADGDLVRLLESAAVEHSIAVAGRPGLGAPVVEAILAQDRPEALAALAGNPQADLGPAALERLVYAARRVAAVRAPLANNPKLTADLALKLYVLVGETLRDVLATRFALDPVRLQSALDAAGHAAHAGEPGPGEGAAEPEQAEMERRLVAKLDAAGQLRPGYLLKALREGRLGLFQTTLATLGGFSVEATRAACDGDRPERLALACAAAGVDRSVFPTLLALVRGLNAGRPLGAPASAQAIREAYTLFSPTAAAEAFREAPVAV